MDEDTNISLLIVIVFMIIGMPILISFEYHTLKLKQQHELSLSKCEALKSNAEKQKIKHRGEK